MRKTILLRFLLLLAVWLGGCCGIAAAIILGSHSDSPAEMKINLPEDLREKKELAWLPAKVDVSVGAWDYSALHL